MGRLTTHVLDTASGRPAEGVRILLFRIDGDTRTAIGGAMTNGDGRCDAPLIEGDDFAKGIYELVFHVGRYFDGQGLPLSTPGFLDEVPIRFGISAPEQHYHVPLLISPFSYSTYRGS